MKVFAVLDHCSSSVHFISHMVQMKEGNSSMHKEAYQTLYPTWFRWKLYYAAIARQQSDLYIPHGSDESFVVGIKHT